MRRSVKQVRSIKVALCHELLEVELVLERAEHFIMDQASYMHPQYLFPPCPNGTKDGRVVLDFKRLVGLPIFQVAGCECRASTVLLEQTGVTLGPIRPSRDLCGSPILRFQHSRPGLVRTLPTLRDLVRTAEPESGDQRAQGCALHQYRHQDDRERGDQHEVAARQ